MTRSDRHRLLDMQEAVADLAAVVARGKDERDADELPRLAAQKLLEIAGEAAARQPDYSVPLVR